MKKPYKPRKGVMVGGREVPVQRTNWGRSSRKGIAWFGVQPVTQTAYDSKLRTVSNGDFSEEEIREMERLYGGRIQRPRKRAVV